jgi:hypothetical protein
MADVLPAKVRLRHQKYQPFPSHMLDLAESKGDFLAQIDAYGQNESICRLINLPQLHRLVEAFRRQIACARNCAKVTNPLAPRRRSWRYTSWRRRPISNSTARRL